MYKRIVNKFKRNKGITLIELLITLAILSIVIMITFSMHTFGNNTFNTGSKQSEVQSNLRLASNYITKVLRYSSNVEILATMPVTPDTSKEYIYCDSGSLKHYSVGNIKTITSSADSLTTNIEFQEQDPQTVYFKLDSTLKGESYSIDSTVVSLNIASKSIIGTGTGPVISFTKGEETLMNIIAKPVTGITISAPSNTVQVNGGKMQFSCTLVPADASIKSVTWSVDDTSKATIDANTGLLTVITSTSGVDIVVKAKANDGSGVSATYKVTTTSTNIAMTSFTVNSPSDYVLNNNGTIEMSIKDIVPSTATDLSVIWSINKDSSIAIIDVDSGLLTTKNTTTSQIQVTVTATAKNNAAVKATKVITIIPRITNIKITGDGPIKDNNGSLQLSCDITPADASTGTVKEWQVSGDTNATISSDGTLKTGKGNGNKVTAESLTVTVSVTTLDGNKQTATKTITVN